VKSLGQIKRPLWRVGVFALGIRAILTLWPFGPIQGTYLSPEPLVCEHEFLLFRDGAVYSIADNPPPVAPSIVYLGDYRFEKGSGWIWKLRGTDRQIACKPYLLFMRFSWSDGNKEAATDPFQWRDPYFWKVRRVLQDASVRSFLASRPQLTIE
jgi:hypothetical protein